MQRKTNHTPRRSVLLAAAGLLALPGVARAQAWAPTRPVRLVVAYPPGGATDLVARWVARELTPRLGQPVVVENRPGANGILGSQAVQQAAPDGHTLIFTTADTHSVNPVVYRRLPYQPQNFVPVSAVARLVFSLVTRPGLGTRSVREFVDLAKSRAANSLTFASWGIASTSQVMMETFKFETGTEMQHVPFQGAAPAVTALLSDQVDSMMLPVAVALSQGGRLPILGVATARRFPAVPQVPTLTEEGINLTGDLWLSILAPPGTPEPIAERIAQETQAFVRKPEALDFLTPNGLIADTAERRRFITYLQEEDAIWRARVARLNVRLDD
ncbi:tripartite tricarboxylate transporter substrate binding protein [Siccirubricoccus sp. G192]|uniref:Bug family tripartite tricarboxylate transporter substrate binding protein n=1 Tax=Siccirubricoccus sp. G192 TaxID=2849651 RepID=UPI001C2C25AD|nr:tripartite tricarboxylate transporter substrate binding protein [Siccirubricoccus sp. G192]MBV1796490.1 tripartite tricarboxylate transporter substrate binding protein [Siccirubricoccus sp. G192]